MRVLIDACLPAKLAQHIPQQGVATVREMGWQQLKNGELLTRAQNDFDVLITMDKNIPVSAKPLPILDRFTDRSLAFKSAGRPLALVA